MLWRGPPLEDVATEPFASLEIRRLEELRLDAIELALQQDLDAGRPAEVVRELQSLIAQEPLRERLHGLLMLALNAGGRAYVWDIRPASLVRQACAVAGRRLTRAEWAAFLPGRAYAPAC